MNSKLVTIGVVAALAAIMVGIGVGTSSAFASTHNHQSNDQHCRGGQVGCNQNNAQDSSHFGQFGNLNLFDD
jgi:hypothetical protein